MARTRIFEELGLPDDCSPEIVVAVEYWLSIRPGENLPGRQHFDPTDIPKMLRYTWLIDVNRDPLAFTFRLVGTGVVDFFGSDPTGHRLDHVFEDFENTIACRDFREVVEKREPRWRRGTATLSHGDKIGTLERIYLPFARNGSDVDMIFCLTVFNP